MDTKERGQSSWGWHKELAEKVMSVFCLIVAAPFVALGIALMWAVITS